MYFYLPGSTELVFNLKGEVFSLNKPDMVIGHYNMKDNVYINNHGMVVNFETGRIEVEPEDVIYIPKKNNEFLFDYRK